MEMFTLGLAFTLGMITALAGSAAIILIPLALWKRFSRKGKRRG